MCGFAGLVSSTPIEDNGGLLPAITRQLKASHRTLSHRGPDSHGLWHDPHCALTHARLRVIGSSDHGHQPMVDASGRYVIAYNGAIYNFRDLASLAGFKGNHPESDTRVLIEGFAKFGPAWFAKLNGMFAIAIWDKQETCLYLARDSYGQKPLYYAQAANGFIFGSQPKALFPLMPDLPEADPAALHHYLSLGYMPAPHTGFKGVQKLFPGSILQIGLTPDGITEPSIAPFSPEITSSELSTKNADNSAVLMRKLETAVQRCLIADVPLGAFLSGGVDSSAIVAMMSRLSPNTIQTFSVGFADSKYDETPHARQVAKHLGTEHHEIIFDNNIANFAVNLAEHYDEPYGDSSAIPTLALSEMTRKHVIVALSGDGSDELFLGYPRYAEMIRQARLSRVPTTVANAAALTGRITGLSRLKNLGEKAGARGEALYFPMVSHFSDAMKYDGYTERMGGFLPNKSQALFFGDFPRGTPMIEAAANADLRHYLPDDLMTKTDRASMAFALEVRAPFLDTELSHWARSLPWDQKYFDQSLKALLKKSVAPLLPADILSRPKQGFSVPLADWLRGPLKAITEELLLTPDSFCQTLLKPAFVKDMVTSHMTGKRNHDQRIWLLFMLENWARRWGLT